MLRLHKGQIGQISGDYGWDLPDSCGENLERARRLFIGLGVWFRMKSVNQFLKTGIKRKTITKSAGVLSRQNFGDFPKSFIKEDKFLKNEPPLDKLQFKTNSYCIAIWNKANM